MSRPTCRSQLTQLSQLTLSTYIALLISHHPESSSTRCVELFGMAEMELWGVPLPRRFAASTRSALPRSRPESPSTGANSCASSVSFPAPRRTVSMPLGGASITIRPGAAVQFRTIGSEPLRPIMCTTPSWTGHDEAELVQVHWPSHVE